MHFISNSTKFDKITHVKCLVIRAYLCTDADITNVKFKKVLKQKGGLIHQNCPKEHNLCTSTSL